MIVFKSFINFTKETSMRILVLILALMFLPSCDWLKGDDGDDGERGFTGALSNVMGPEGPQGRDGGTRPPHDPTYNDLLRYPGDYSSNPIRVTWSGRVVQVFNYNKGDSRTNIQMNGETHAVGLNSTSHVNINYKGETKNFTADITDVVMNPQPNPVGTTYTMVGTLISIE